jgi:hypothetical protein
VSIRTSGEAIALIHDLARRQLERAASERTGPNQATQGDSELRRAFWLLLGPDAKRSVFLELCKRRDFWPRIRSCIGVPPFSFLKPVDNGVLNAGGISIGKINMASDSGISSSFEIGSGQFSDTHDRRYAWIRDDNTRSTEIPTVRVRSAKRVIVDMRLPKLKIAERREISKRSHGKDASIHYPKPGDQLRLVSHEALGGEPLVLVVRTVESRGHRSPVARLYCTR